MFSTHMPSGITLSPDSLPPKQREVLEHILAFIRENGYPPSIQQLCHLCGVSSTSTVHYHVSALKKKGFIDWNPAEKRSISVHPELRHELYSEHQGGYSKEASSEHALFSSKPRSGTLPMLGTIAAGSPLQTLADQTDELDLSEDVCPPGCYALKVRGESMIEDHIMDGDIVIINPKAPVRDGDVVVALIENQTATLKRIYRERDAVRLQPANASMEPIFVRDVNVQGKVEAILRKLR